MDWFISLQDAPALSPDVYPSALVVALRALGARFRYLYEHYDNTEHAMTIIDALANTHPMPRQVSFHLQAAFTVVFQAWEAIQQLRRADCPVPFPLVTFNTSSSDSVTNAWFGSLHRAIQRAPPSSLLTRLSLLHQAFLTQPTADVYRPHRPVRHRPSHYLPTEDPAPKRRRI